MLHAYQEASRRTLPFPPAVEEAAAPGRELFSMLCVANDWLGRTPYIHGSAEGKSINILYRSVAYPIEDFWNSFCLSMAAIGRDWPVCAYGTARSNETVQLEASLQDGHIQLVQRSISGKSTDVLETLCFQIDCPDRETTGKLLEFLSAINWQTGIAVTDWNNADFLRAQELIPNPSFRGMFCYAGVEPEITPDECLLSLNLAQKNMLWLAFFQEKFEPLEFEWLAQEIAKERICNRVEWELALREAVNRMNYRIVNQAKSFELFDETGKKLYFGVDGHSATQRVLMKILFPLNF